MAKIFSGARAEAALALVVSWEGGARHKADFCGLFLVAFLACNASACQVNKSVLAAIAYLCV